MNKVITWLTF